MKELIRVRVQYASRQQCCKTHKQPLPFTFLLKDFGIPICVNYGVLLTDRGVELVRNLMARGNAREGK